MHANPFLHKKFVLNIKYSGPTKKPLQKRTGQTERYPHAERELGPKPAKIQNSIFEKNSASLESTNFKHLKYTADSSEDYIIVMGGLNQNGGKTK